MTRYILRHIFHLTMFALLVGGLLVGSSRTDSQPNKSIVLQADAQLAKCGTVDASVTGSPRCVVTKGQDEIVWENRHKPKGVYMCVNSKKDPFEAYAWYIPYNTQRNSGMVRQDVLPDPVNGYDFYSSDNPCKDPPTHTGSTPRNTPHVIIQ